MANFCIDVPVLRRGTVAARAAFMRGARMSSLPTAWE
jgi:hypothetical protein